MATISTLPALLESLSQSLTSAQEVAPRLTEIDHQKDGISLLDVKNELLLSYLQNLVFLILLKLRNAKSDTATDDDIQLDDAVRSKLVELRLYLEKGARPLEEKLKFSIERFLRTAQDAQREDRHKEQAGMNSDSDEDGDEDEEESDDDAPKARQPNVSAAPNIGAMKDTARPVNDENNGPAGIYRPPKRDRQVMETTSQRREKTDRRANKSHTMDEFVADELSAAPMAQPSIGTTIVNGGRRMKTTGERKDEAERQAYEESNFVRLPAESKKDRAKKNKAMGNSQRMQFGGEEWHDLGEGVDRIDRLTKRKDGGRGGNVRAMLDKSRKRGLETTDGPRGSGVGGAMGERFQKRVKTLDSGRARDRGKK